MLHLWSQFGLRISLLSGSGHSHGRDQTLRAFSNDEKLMDSPPRPRTATKTFPCSWVSDAEGESERNERQMQTSVNE